MPRPSPRLKGLPWTMIYILARLLFGGATTLGHKKETLDYKVIIQ